MNANKQKLSKKGYMRDQYWFTVGEEKNIFGGGGGGGSGIRTDM